jgi:hypothetical protein
MVFGNRRFAVLVRTVSSLWETLQEHDDARAQKGETKNVLYFIYLEN